MAAEHPIPTHWNFKDLRGHPPFGRLTVVSYAGRRKVDHVWLCRCECGGEKVLTCDTLMSGGTRSCGCYKMDRIKESNTHHGKSQSITYRSWASMIARCTNPKEKSYPDYGGRGITVCDRWRHSFENFYADMGDKPSQLHSIERKDNNAGYFPGNCVWETRSVQCRNRRSNVILEMNGKRMCRLDWSKETGISFTTIRNRMRSGWSVEDALTKPVRVMRKSR